MNESCLACSFTKEAIQTELIKILTDMLDEWDLDFSDPISGETALVEDLDFESIDLIQLIVAIEKRFDVKGLPFENILMEDSAYIDEIYVHQLRDFLFANLNNEN